MLYLDSENPQEVADEFDIPLEIAEKLVERDKAIKENPLEAMTETSGKLFAGISAILGKPEKSELYDKAFEFVASSGNEEPAALAEALEISVEQASLLIEEMRLHGDIASEDDGEERNQPVNRILSKKSNPIGLLFFMDFRKTLCFQLKNRIFASFFN